jgi:hypothetical protein
LGLMDNLRAQVDSLAQQANAGIAKLDNLPVQRKSDALLRSLGVAVLADRTGRGHQGTSAEIERLITEITQHESQNNINVVQQAAQAAAQAQPGPQVGGMGAGSYQANSPSGPSPNVAGTMPGAGAGYGGYGPPGGSGSGFGGPPAPGVASGPGGSAETYVFPEPAPHRDQR